MKITVNFLRLFKNSSCIFDKRTKKQCTAVFPCGQIHDWIAEQIMIPILLDLLDFKEKGA